MSVFAYVLPAVTLLAGIDQAKQAKHQGKVQLQQQQQQQQQIDEANAIERQKLVQAERLAQQQLAAQQRAQAAAIAQAQRAQAESKALMDKQLKAADENMNRSMQKRPDTRRIQDQAEQAGKAGASGTMLTGPQGVDTASLQLGRNTLLGQ